MFLAGHNHVHIQERLAECIRVVSLLVSLCRLEGLGNVYCAEFGHFFPTMSIKYAKQSHLSLFRVI